MTTDKNRQEFKPSEIEQKWQEKWESDHLFSPDVKNAKNPFYNLMMFPYPSAEGLHVGNMYAFTGADVFARFQRMQGKDVLEPIGLDGFGIHSENYALKVGRHPKEQAQIAEKNFYRQLRAIGDSFDWNRTVETYDPEYYKWTQWLFIQLFKTGLAYRQTALVNWCPSCKTVLSDEQVIDGKCERCGTVVEKRDLEQWFFRITNYAERLLNNIEGLNWTEKVKIAQRNWIGKSEGAEIQFSVLSDQFSDNGQSIDQLTGQQKTDQLEAEYRQPKTDNRHLTVFTTRPDTLYGATFMVIAPEHQLALEIANGSYPSANIQAVKKYIEIVKSRSEIERTAEGKEKTGVLTGLNAINPVNGEAIPILICDYVLGGYGTGAIMAVPAHDQRDFETAKAFNLPIRHVIKGKSNEKTDESADEAYTGSGIIIGSKEWDGWEVPADIPKVISWLEERGIGTRKANYHLRDWLISRQRYWGPPIPMIYCEKCAGEGKSYFTEHSEYSESQKNQGSGVSESPIDRSSESSEFSGMAGWFPVPDDQLPVTLPSVSDWKPMGTGKSPLANHPEFYKTTCPNCGGEATRETDVSDTFLDSAWYFLRYPSVSEDSSGPAAAHPHPTSSLLASSDSGRSMGVPRSASPEVRLLPWNPEVTKKWLPVDQYIGGAEHSVLHLLYSRFITMVLHDLNYIDFEEPFTNFFAHGLIIKDGAKMSKSKGNVVVPDEYIAKYGADTLRTYLMFIGPYSDGGDFRDSGIEGMHRFLRKVWNLLSEYSESQKNQGSGVSESPIDRSSESSEFSERNRMMHRTIQRVTKDVQTFSYNTAIAALMEWYNYLNSEVRSNVTGQMSNVSFEEAVTYLKLLAPFAPHMTEELWQRNQSSVSGSQLSDSSQSVDQLTGQQTTDQQDTENRQQKTDNWSIHLSQWPEYEEKYLVSDVVTIVVQVNGKKRGEFELQSSEIQNKFEPEKRAKEAVAKHLEGVEIKKIIYIPGKIVNIVV